MGDDSKTEMDPLRPRVLVVDDDPANLDTFRRVFRRDLEMTLASNAAEALALFHPDKFDVVVTDHAMPGMVGAVLLVKLREIEPCLGVVLVTAHADLPAVRDVRASGIPIAVVMKPWRKEELLRWIHQAAKMTRLRSAVAAMKSRS